MDCSPPGFSVHGILQARTLEWVAISFSNAWKWKVKVKSLSRVWLLATPWTAAYQAPPSMGFSRQEYWSGVPLPSPCNILNFLYISRLPLTSFPFTLCYTVGMLGFFSSFNFTMKAILLFLKDFLVSSVSISPHSFSLDNITHWDWYWFFVSLFLVCLCPTWLQIPPS